VVAYTFYKALGIPTGISRVEADKVQLAEELLALAKEKGIKFLLPVDDIETDEIEGWRPESEHARAFFG